MSTSKKIEKVRTFWDVLKEYHKAHPGSLKAQVVIFKEAKKYVCQETGLLIDEKVCFTSPDGKKQLGCFKDIGALGKWLEGCGMIEKDKGLVEETAGFDTIKLEDEIRERELKAKTNEDTNKSDATGSKAKPFRCGAMKQPNSLKLDDKAFYAKNAGDAMNQLIARYKVLVGSDKFRSVALRFDVSLTEDQFSIMALPCQGFPEPSAFEASESLIIGVNETAKPKPKPKPKAEPKQPKAKKQKVADKMEQ